MRRVCLLVIFLACISLDIAIAQDSDFSISYTEFDHPDLQGVWAVGFITTIERPEGIDGLIASGEDIAAIQSEMATALAGNVDPEFEVSGITQLAKVRGEFRTSLVVQPEDGRIPYNDAGLALAERLNHEYESLFDHPEQRPLTERWSAGWAVPPIRTLPLTFYHQIIQVPDYVLIASEDTSGLRIIHLDGAPPETILPSYKGYSSGRWEGETLIVETTHFRDDEPERETFTRPVLLGSDSVIVEKFTLLSRSELLYQFSVTDANYYTETWSGEFSFARHDGRTYEFVCHEGNYSFPGILRGGQREAIAETEPSDAVVN